ncbi:MAG: 4-diphosphocytidyl-2-C-methyl-D-erythritol kinase [Pseudomonadota bacterium]|jgi:4-diphosphocytidyl-2-C-methyl-D-erythritol kinase
MTRLTETAFAKINLALHVRRRRPDGYHDLESIFAFADQGDILNGVSADGISLAINGRFATGLSNGAENLVMRAAVALQSAFGISTGAALSLEKNLPIASGIGGGSADAAAALRLLARMWGIDPADPQILEIAAVLGADVPPCLASNSLFGAGRGDILSPINIAFEGAPLLLVNPLVPLSTGTVFAGWDGADRGPIDVADPASWRNDLTTPALSIVPAIADILDQLGGQSGARFVRMSGSGATCFAVFETPEDAAAAAGSFPDAWTLLTHIR